MLLLRMRLPAANGPGSESVTLSRTEPHKAHRRRTRPRARTAINVSANSAHTTMPARTGMARRPRNSKPVCAIPRTRPRPLGSAVGRGAHASAAPRTTASPKSMPRCRAKRPNPGAVARMRKKRCAVRKGAHEHAPSWQITDLSGGPFQSGAWMAGRGRRCRTGSLARLPADGIRSSADPSPHAHVQTTGY